MNSKYKSILGTFSALMLAGAIQLPMGAAAQDNAAENVQVLTRGPVHEAFAEAVSYDPQPGIIVSTRVPEPIEELPPEQKPEGNNVTWISGYWAWDEDQNDFIWISGIWRNLPPGRQWVPGYWTDINDGKFQWTSGYWADATTEEVTYVPTAPPRSVDAGPNVEAPSSDHSWIPGNWYWSDSRYLWRPGYWLPLRTNWTWMPSRYCWTRRGYVYVDGYWDYAVASRGVLFAPVYFRDQYYATPGYYYTPLIVVGLNVFANHLFYRPTYGHYYFGDYYAPRYQTGGYYASYSWGSGRRGGYDPIYAYDRWENRADRTWERRRQDDFNYFRDTEDARPPRTWAAMRDYRTERFNDGRNRVFASPLSNVVQEPNNVQRFSTLDQSARQQLVSQNTAVRNFSRERRQLESQNVVAGAEPAKTAAVREKISRSPITGREADQFSENDAPPKRPEARGNKPDTRLAPQETPQAKANRTQEMRKSDNRQEPGTDPAQRGSERMNRETDPSKNNTPERQAQQREERTKPQAQPTRDRNPAEATQQPSQRKERPSPQAQPAPERKPQTESRPERQPKQSQPQPAQRKVREAPQRQDKPKAQAQPQPAPQQAQRKAQEAPQRQAQPKPQAQPPQERQARQQPAPQQAQRKAQEAPQRQAQPKPQAQPAPERQARQQAAPQQAQRKAQEAPQRQAQPKPQAQPAPERQARQQAAPQQVQRKAQEAPQRQAQPAPQAQPKQQAAPQTEGQKGRKSAEEDDKQKKR